MYESLINQDTITTIIALAIVTCLISGIFQFARTTEKIGDEEK